MLAFFFFFLVQRWLIIIIVAVSAMDGNGMVDDVNKEVEKGQKGDRSRTSRGKSSNDYLLIDATAITFDRRWSNRDTSRNRVVLLTAVEDTVQSVLVSKQ